MWLVHVFVKMLDHYFLHLIFKLNVLNLFLGTVMKNMITDQLIADYLLYWLNKHSIFSYVDYLKIDQPSDRIEEVLVKTAIQQNRFLQRVLGSELINFAF